MWFPRAVAWRQEQTLPARRASAPPPAAACVARLAGFPRPSSQDSRLATHRVLRCARAGAMCAGVLHARAVPAETVHGATSSAHSSGCAPDPAPMTPVRGALACFLPVRSSPGRPKWYCTSWPHPAPRRPTMQSTTPTRYPARWPAACASTPGYWSSKPIPTGIGCCAAARQRSCACRTRSTAPGFHAGEPPQQLD